MEKARGLCDTASERKRGRFKGCQAAQRWVAVTPVAPNNPMQWSYVMATGETTATLRVEPDVRPGSTIWITARRLNPRMGGGPIAPPQSVRVHFATSRDQGVEPEREGGVSRGGRQTIVAVLPSPAHDSR